MANPTVVVLLVLLLVLPALPIVRRRIRLGTHRSLILGWLLLLGIFGAGIYHDLAPGEVTPVRVIRKTETVEVAPDGKWSRRILVEVGRLAEHEPRTPARVSCDGPTFDKLVIGQTMEARVTTLGAEFFRLPACESLLHRFLPHRPHGPWQTASAVVREKVHVTVNQGDDSPDTLWRWPFEVIVLEFTPPGRSEPLEAVHEVDATSVPDLKVGDVVPITWPQDDPRSARMIGVKPAAWLGNQVYDLIDQKPAPRR